jgi:hypothetical protein
MINMFFKYMHFTFWSLSQSMLFQSEDFYEQNEDLVRLTCLQFEGRVKQEIKRWVLPKNALYWILQSILQDAGKLEFGKCLFQTAMKSRRNRDFILHFVNVWSRNDSFCVNMTSKHIPRSFSTFSNLSIYLVVEVQIPQASEIKLSFNKSEWWWIMNTRSYSQVKDGECGSRLQSVWCEYIVVDVTSG